MRLEVVPNFKRFDPEALKDHGLRAGQWVLCEGRAAILTECSPLFCKAMLVREDGSNLVEVATNPWTLRKAGLADIPAPRRPINADAAARLGYT